MTITQLTTNGFSKSPDIFGDRIVWIENGKDTVLFDGSNNIVLPDLGVNLAINPQISADGVTWNGYDGGWQAFYYDGIQTTQLTNHYSVNDQKLSGDRLVWRSAPTHMPGGNLFEVYVYDAKTQATLQLTDNDSREGSVDVSGQNVVWSGTGNSIWLHDGTKTVQLPGTGIQPHVSGNLVAWKAYSGGKPSEIHLYDGNSTTKIVDSNDSVRIEGFFDGNLIWGEWDDNDWELFRYKDGNTIQVTDNDFNDRLSPNSTPSSYSSSSTTAVDGSGDNLVWSSYVNGNWEIFVYDGNKTIQVTDNDVDDLNPKISGNTVVWNTQGATSDIFKYEISDSGILNSDFSNIFSDSFDVDVDNTQWQEISNASVNSNFGGSGNSLYFSGGSRGGEARFATSNALDLSAGGTISFDLIFGNSSNGGENADAGEDVVLEYSTDGSSWSQLARYDTEGYTSWTTIDRVIPTAAQTTATTLRWRQVNQSGSSFDNWGLDNVNVSDKSVTFDSIAENFEDINSSQWFAINGGEVNSNFGGDGKSLFFTGGKYNDDSRQLTTTGLNVSNGGTISFDLIFGNSSNGGENADAGEDVALEFSLDGNSWQEIAIYDTEAFTTWTGISESIPLEAQTVDTQFRWLQVAHSGSSFDNWALDNISIEAIG